MESILRDFLKSKPMHLIKGECLKVKNLIIVGAGGFGREVYSYLKQDSKNNIEWTIKGFIDDVKFSNYNDNHSNYRILNTIMDYEIETNDIFVIAITDPSGKELVVKKLEEKNADFFTYVSDRAFIGENVSIGNGAVISPNVILTCDIKIGDFVTFNCNSTVGHDAIIGDYTTINSFCSITGNSKVDKYVFFGSHSFTLPSSTIGERAVIGAGSLVLRRVMANTSVMGTPAKKVVIPKK